jgi:hypothetical protein
MEGSCEYIEQAVVDSQQGVSSWGGGGVDDGLTTSYETDHRTLEVQSFLERLEQREMDKRFGTWNVRSLYRSGSLVTVARELSRCRLDLVGVQEVRWDKGGTVGACIGQGHL